MELGAGVVGGVRDVVGVRGEGDELLGEGDAEAALAVARVLAVDVLAQRGEVVVEALAGAGEADAVGALVDGEQRGRGGGPEAEQVGEDEGDAHAGRQAAEHRGEAGPLELPQQRVHAIEVAVDAAGVDVYWVGDVVAEDVVEDVKALLGLATEELLDVAGEQAEQRLAGLRGGQHGGRQGQPGELAQALERVVARATHVERDRVQARQLGGEDLAERGRGGLHRGAGVRSSTIFCRARRLAELGLQRGPEFRLHGGVVR